MGGVLSTKLIGTAAGIASQAVPGGGIAVKIIGGVSSLLNKAIRNKTTKAEEKLEVAKARLAQFESLQGKGLADRGTDQTTTPAQNAVFGKQPTETAGYYSTPKDIAQFSTLKKTNPDKMENKMEYSEMLKKYWWVAAAAVLLLFFGKKRR